MSTQTTHPRTCKCNECDPSGGFHGGRARHKYGDLLSNSSRASPMSSLSPLVDPEGGSNHVQLYEHAASRYRKRTPVYAPPITSAWGRSVSIEWAALYFDDKHGDKHDDVRLYAGNQGNEPFAVLFMVREGVIRTVLGTEQIGKDHPLMCAVVSHLANEKFGVSVLGCCGGGK